MRYIRTTHALLAGLSSPDESTQRLVTDRMERIRTLEVRYMPSTRVWSEVFSQEVQSETQTKSDKAVQLAFQSWRKQDAVEATITWAEWLLKQNRGKDAIEIISTFMASGREGRAEVERRWADLLNDQSEED